MKVKNFTAGSINEALLQVKETLGVEAVILSTQNIGGQVQVTAAIDEVEEFNFDADEKVEVINTRRYFDDTALRESLSYHGILDLVQDKILAASRQISREQEIFRDTKVLEAAFGCLFDYSAILAADNPLKMFMGTPGSGKSTAIAKMAALAKMQGKKCLIISTDNSKAGANKQLEAFADILQAPFLFVKNERKLFEICQNAKADNDFILIDTPGINPFLENEVEKVSRFAMSVKADKILTMDASKNPYEAVEIAEIFTEIGARFLLPTRMDLTRRIGAIVSAASCCSLTFCGASVSSSIANGLAAVDNKSLAKLVLA